MPHVPRIPWTWTVVGAICVWLAVICCSLLTQQGPAAPGTRPPKHCVPTRRRPVHQQDPASFQRLFAPGTAGSGYAKRYFTELFAVPATGLRLDLETHTDSGSCTAWHPADGGALYDAWPVQNSGGRSVLSAVPLTTDPCDAGS